LERNPKLRNNTSSKDKGGIFGLPLPLFAFGTLFSCFGIGIAISKIGLFYGLMFGFLYSSLIFVPLRMVHKDDINAWLLWLSTIKAPFFTSNSIEKKKILVIQNERVIPFKQWRQTR